MYYLTSGGQQTGPFSGNQIRQDWQAGLIAPEAYYWCEGMTEWRLVSELMAELVGGPAPCIPAGFLRRLTAFLLDVLLLSIAAFLMGIFASSFFEMLGGLGPIVGYVMFVAYMGILNSSVGKGQTAGKRALRIQVVNQAGQHLDLPRSLARAAILGIPFFWQIELFMAMTSSFVVATIESMLSMALGLFIAYLFSFNRPLRQSVHDFAVKSYVVKTGTNGPVLPVPFWRGHYAFLGAFVLLMLMCGGGGFILAGKSLLAGPLKVENAVLQSGKVRTASVNVGKNWSNINGQISTSSSYSVDAWIPRSADVDATVRDLANLVLEQDKDTASDQEEIVIHISQGYTVGIASQWKSQTFSHAPAEWEKIIADKSAP